MTEAGRAYLERCLECLQAFDDSEAAIGALAEAPRGLLRVAGPFDYNRHLPRWIARFLKAHPAIDVDLVLSNRTLDLVDERIDVYVRVTNELPPDVVARQHRVYALAGDGCLMEGLSHEAASLAGHLQLDNLCWIYDNNKITIEGHTHLAFSEDVATRFISYGWNVTRVGDANNLEMLDRAYQHAEQTKGRPTLIIVDSHIGYGAPNKQDSHAAHGEPLGAEEIKLTKRFYGWPEEAKFLVPDGVVDHFTKHMGTRGGSLRSAWKEKLERYRIKLISIETPPLFNIKLLH